MGQRQAGDRGIVPLRPLPVQPGPDRRLRLLLDQLRGEAAQADREGDSTAAADLRRAAVALAARHGAITRESLVATGTPARATCFGSFALRVGGAPLALSSLRPRARSALRLLALQDGRPLHRDVLLDTLWPEADEASASRSMLTTLSSVRAVLAGTAAEGALLREGAAYRLDPDRVHTDVGAAETALQRAARCRSVDADAAEQAWAGALDLYAGELLVEEGPAEWVVSAREQWRTRMATAAHELAVLRYSRGCPARAAAAARRGLALDRHSDPLWRVLIASLRAGEDEAAAGRAEQDYGRLLDELAV